MVVLMSEHWVGYVVHLGFLFSIQVLLNCPALFSVNYLYMSYIQDN